MTIYKFMHVHVHLPVSDLVWVRRTRFVPDFSHVQYIWCLFNAFTSCKYILPENFLETNRWRSFHHDTEALLRQGSCCKRSTHASNSPTLSILFRQILQIHYNFLFRVNPKQFRSFCFNSVVPLWLAMCGSVLCIILEIDGRVSKVSRFPVHCFVLKLWHPMNSDPDPQVV